LIWLSKGNIIRKYCDEILSHVKIEIVPGNVNRYGSVPVDPVAARNIDVILIGCDVGDNGSLLNELTDIGSELYSNMV